MKKAYRSLGVLFAVGVLSLMQACQKEDQLSTSQDDVTLKKAGNLNNPVRTFYSSTLPIGNGIARAWVKENLNGDPVAVGLNLSEKALQNLPLEPAMFTFILPKNKGKNFYTLIGLDWNPQGHEPPHVYGLPHFDFHFYIIPDEERMAIPGSLDFDKPIDSKYVPANYNLGPGIVPMMGAHWVDVVTSPEWNGETFTKTFIWGSYNGEFIFWEPMVTLDYLLDRPRVDVETDVPQPEFYQKDGYYATKYEVSYSDSPGQYTIALLNLVYREGE